MKPAAEGKVLRTVKEVGEKGRKSAGEMKENKRGKTGSAFFQAARNKLRGV